VVVLCGVLAVLRETFICRLFFVGVVMRRDVVAVYEAAFVSARIYADHIAVRVLLPDGREFTFRPRLLTSSVGLEDSWRKVGGVEEFRYRGPPNLLVYEFNDDCMSIARMQSECIFTEL